MSIYEDLLKEIRLPKVVKVKYKITDERINDVEGEVIKQLKMKNVLGGIRDGNTVAIAVGSREVSNLAVIVKTLVNQIKSQGGKPFIIPAMGSHGGATAQGQKEVISFFGITEKSMGVPVKSSMETVEIGTTADDIPVYMDRYAYQADYIIPVGRIKPHTDFRGRYESGLMKMIAVGLGKQKGASICHQLGLDNMSVNIEKIVQVSLKKTNIVFGVGIIENAFHDTYRIEVLTGKEIPEEEPELLQEAKKLISGVPFNKVDVIVVDEMGKDISGTGMDSNVIGRSSTLGIWRPFAERVVVLDLTDKSHGNANGIGLADITTQRLFNKMSFEQTYPNVITSAEPKAVKIPIVMPNDELAVKCAIMTCTKAGKENIRLVRIKNTLSMNEFLISQTLIREAQQHRDMEMEEDVYEMELGKHG